MSELAAAAARLRELHDGAEPLVLPNAWDAASARALAEAGFPALATSSGAVAAALGGADRERTDPELVFAATARMGRVAAAAGVPLTADVEGGYGLAPAALVARLLDAGAVGLNLEDTDHAAGAGLVDAERQAERIAAVKAAGRAAGVELWLNARVDASLRGLGAEESLDRARRYVAAGADSVYPILLEDEAQLARHVAEAGVPVNAMLRRGGPTRARLAALGVRRLSTGESLFDAAQAALAGAAAALRTGGDPFAG